MTEVVNNQPPKFEWRVYRGDSTNLTIAALDENGDQYDLTDYEFEGHVREMPNSNDVIENLTISVQENIINIGLPTTELPTMSYFDIQGINNISNKTTTFLSGIIFLEEDVTR